MSHRFGDSGCKAIARRPSKRNALEVARDSADGRYLVLMTLTGRSPLPCHHKDMGDSPDIQIPIFREIAVQLDSE